MKLKYNKTDDVLMIELNDKPIDYAEQNGDLIVHFSPKREAVLLEILDALQFFKKAAKTLPSKLIRDIFQQPSVVAYRIK